MTDQPQDPTAEPTSPVAQATAEPATESTAEPISAATVPQAGSTEGKSGAGESVRIPIGSQRPRAVNPVKPIPMMRQANGGRTSRRLAAVRSMCLCRPKSIRHRTPATS